MFICTYIDIFENIHIFKQIGIYVNMYNRKKAIDYAYAWWNKRNPMFYNFDKLGGDCTNFISQCLYFGEIQMNTYSTNGWFYHNSYSRSPSWTGVEEFYNFATNNKSNFGPKVKVVTISEIEIGDIVQMKQTGNRYHHNLLITKITKKNSLINIFVTCHTNDAKDKKLSDYYFNEIRFLKILN